MAQSQALNIQGIFRVFLEGKDRDVKITFGVVEDLESFYFKRPLVQVLNDSVNGKIFLKDVVNLIYCGLHANQDTRFSREQIGEYVLEQGLINYKEFFETCLTYSVSGKTAFEVEPVNPKKK
jgi:hypothetical protein